jgi:hypothetical protein
MWPFSKKPPRTYLSAEDQLIVNEYYAAHEAWSKGAAQVERTKHSGLIERAYAAAACSIGYDRFQNAEKAYDALKARLKERARAELEKMGAA